MPPKRIIQDNPKRLKHVERMAQIDTMQGRVAHEIWLFLRRHRLCHVDLARLLEVSSCTIGNWINHGPAHPIVVRLALRQLDREFRRQRQITDDASARQHSHYWRTPLPEWLLSEVAADTGVGYRAPAPGERMEPKGTGYALVHAYRTAPSTAQRTAYARLILQRLTPEQSKRLHSEYQ
jgi:hypothetical protein